MAISSLSNVYEKGADMKNVIFEIVGLLYTVPLHSTFRHARN